MHQIQQNDYLHVLHDNQDFRDSHHLMRAPPPLLRHTNYSRKHSVAVYEFSLTELKKEIFSIRIINSPPESTQEDES